MAEENEAAEDGGGKKKIIMLAVIGLVLIGLTIGGTLFAVQMLSPEPEAEVALGEDGKPIPPEGEAVVEEETIKPAIYFPLKPPIIVNFQARGRQRFMQAEVSLMTRDNEVIEAIELHMPMLRNSLVLKFGGQEYEELQTEEGRELLRQEALKELQGLKPFSQHVVLWV
jgi:flagellar FliL protein